jgi:hypothetical protein
MKKPIAKLHHDLALLYRGVRVYHTLRDLEAGRQNATLSEHWLTWAFLGRSLDKGHAAQFDVRELPNSGAALVDKVAFQSPLLAAATVQRLAAFIDGELAKPKAARAWEKAKG